MERPDILKKHEILHRLSSLPAHLLSLHGNENVSEFVLHELCDAGCFNITKAAYVVDNPDFDCIKGIAGFAATESYNAKRIWDDPASFSEHMRKSAFNTKVRDFIKPSMRRTAQSDENTSKIVAEFVGITKPAYCSWNMKHDNHGILIYETQISCPLDNEMLRNGACFLGFCPIN
ncbi:MAG: hypothetical protein AMXMBFR12_07440 [Candidatus Babeliales bacterium]